jgi:hypothetical protein
LPEIRYVSPRPPKEDSELHRLARAGDAAAIRAFLAVHGNENLDELNAGKDGRIHDFKFLYIRTQRDLKAY